LGDILDGLRRPDDPERPTVVSDLHGLAGACPAFDLEWLANQLAQGDDFHVSDCTVSHAIRQTSPRAEDPDRDPLVFRGADFARLGLTTDSRARPVPPSRRFLGCMRSSTDALQAELAWETNKLEIQFIVSP